MRSVLISIVFTLFFLSDFLLKAGDIPILQGNHDTFFSIFVLNHYVNTFLTGEFSNFLNMPMLYGFKNNLLLSDHFLVQGLMVLPIFLITKNILVSFVLLVTLIMTISFWAMFNFAYYLTKQTLPSILASIIFVFNPYVMGHFPGFLLLLTLFWIPLIFLFFEKSLKEPNRKDLFLLFMCLSGQLLSSLYYSSFLALILPIYAIFRFKQSKVSPLRLINRGAVLGVVIFSAILIFHIFLYAGSLSLKPTNRSLEDVEVLYSVWISDFMAASPRNLLYGDLKNKISEVNPALVNYRLDWERYLFLGFVPLVIFLFSFKIYKSTDKKLWWVSLGLILFCTILSFGPKIHLSASTILPGPYSILYHLNPLFQFTRVIARFVVFNFFFLSVVVALTTAALREKLERKKAFLVISILIALTLLEYWNKPLEYTSVLPQTVDFYAELNKSDIDVIVNLPIGNKILPIYRESREEDLDSHYLLWAVLLHDKKVLNGFVSFLPDEYYQRSEALSINFPTVSKLNQLKKWGVGGIVLHKEEFKARFQYEEIKLGLEKLAVPVVASTEDLILFDLTNWQL